MVLPTAARAAAAAVTGAFLTAAGQLGVAYGLGILRWDREFTGTHADLWAVQLTWVAWISAVSVVAGAVIGVDVVRRAGRPRGMGLRVIASLAAAVGGAVTVPLVWLPARFAHPPTPTSPGLTAGIVALVALVPGVLAAVAVVSVAPVAADVAAIVTWSGLAALASVMWSVGKGDAVVAPRLAMLGGHGRSVQAAAVYPLMLGVVVLVTLVVAGTARWAGRPKVTVATCGAAGPLLLGFAYLIAGAGGGDLQRVPYTAALVSVPLAVLVSVVVAFARRPVRSTAPTDAEPVAPATDAGPVTPVTHAVHVGSATGTGPGADPTVDEAAKPTPVPAAKPKPAVAPSPTASKAPVPSARTAPDAMPAPAAPPTHPGTTTAADADATGSPDQPSAKSGARRGRRKRGTADAEPVQESDYVEWVRALGSDDRSDQRRAVPAPRHADPAEDRPRRGRRRGMLGLSDPDE
ncbi:MAG TPA: hypothetical protein VF054_14660 [Micromonosporaceae bacterium]